jgi:hypothetical protein
MKGSARERDRSRPPRADEGRQPRGDPPGGPRGVRRARLRRGERARRGAPDRPRLGHLLQLLPGQGGDLPRGRRAHGRRRAPPVRSARTRARSAREFVEGGYRAYFEFIVEDPARFAFLRRNAGTIPAFFGDRVVPQGTGELAEDLRAAMARGELPDVDVDYCAHAMIAAGSSLAPA